MATAIGVVSGVLGIFSFLQEMFPTPDVPENVFNFRIGLDGAQPPGGGGELSDAGGDLPDVRCFNNVGNYLGITVNDGNYCNEGSEACETTVATDNACAYTLFSGNTDALCIGWVSVRFPGGDQYGSPIGNWAQKCDEDFGAGGAWYWSEVLVQTEEQGGVPVSCAWVDEDGDVDTTGIQIHWPEFSGSGGAIEDISYYCENNPSMRFLTEPDPTEIIFWTPARRYMNRRGPITATSPAMPSAAEKRRRSQDPQYARLRKRFETDTRLIKSTNPNHSARRLCASNKSVGPSFVSHEERQFCEMRTKTLFPFCEDVEGGACWSEELQTVTEKGDFITLSSTVPNVAFDQVINWTST